MPIVLAPELYDDDEIGALLYRVLSFGVEEPEPWYLLERDEQIYYGAAGRDFLRLLAKRQADDGKDVQQTMWVFVVGDNAARRVTAHATYARPDVWYVYEGGRERRYVYGATIFATEREALLAGRKVWVEYQASLDSQINAIEQRIAELPTEDVPLK